MKKMSIGAWAYTIGPYADDPVELAHEKAIAIMDVIEPERS